jgi:hypothetical protein
MRLRGNMNFVRQKPAIDCAAAMLFRNKIVKNKKKFIAFA